MHFLINEAELSFLATVDKFSMWAIVVFVCACFHSALWAMFERLRFEEQPTLAKAPDKGFKTILIAMIYFISAFIWGILILAGVFQIWICLNTTFYGNDIHATVIQIIFTISAVLFLQGIVFKVTRWLLGLIRGHDTLIDGFRAYKRIVEEMLMEDEKISSLNDNNIIPQNERGVNMLGTYITQRRKELGLSQAKLAKLSGHPVSTIHGIENGDNQNPRFEIIIDLCEVLDISLNDMRNAFLENLEMKKHKNE